jgi:hypothetical protein
MASQHSRRSWNRADASPTWQSPSCGSLEHASLQDVFATPLAQGWSYQADFSTTFALDRQLRKSYDRLVKESGFTHMACEEMWLGWEETTNRFVRCPKGMKWNATLWAGAGKGGGD